MPLLEGLDGEQKMSKSLGNYIGIYEDADNMYGKTMSLPDRLIPRYFELLTEASPDELARIREALESGENPRDLKMRLAHTLTAMYCGQDAADEAQARFVRVFQRRELPDAPGAFTVPQGIISDGRADMPRLLVAAGMAASLSEARRLIQQGGIKINGEKVLDLQAEGLKDGDILQAGKVKVARLSL